MAPGQKVVLATAKGRLANGLKETKRSTRLVRSWLSYSE